MQKLPVPVDTEFITYKTDYGWQRNVSLSWHSIRMGVRFLCKPKEINNPLIIKAKEKVLRQFWRKLGAI